MNTEIKILEKKIEEKTKLDKELYFNENINMFKITYQYVKHKKLLLYGGNALNLSLPEKKQFYEKFDIPDYDFFSPNAIENGKELADIYAIKGYKDIELKPGIHEGTLKLFVNYIAVADITQVPSKLYKKMFEISKEERPLVLQNNPSLELYIAPFNYLRMALHLELSRPDGFIERWPKIYSRMILFYNTYPVKYDGCKTTQIFNKETDQIVLQLIYESKQYFKNKPYPIFGSEIIKMYLKDSGNEIPKDFIFDENMTAFDIISEDYEKTAEEIAKYLEITAHITSEKHPSLYNNELIPNHILLKYKDRPIIGVYDSQACYAFKKRKKINIASIDTFVCFMYGWLLSDRKYYNKDKIKCAINILLNLQKIYIEKNKLFSPFELHCYGYQPKLEDLKRKKFTKTIPFKVYKPK